MNSNLGLPTLTKGILKNHHYKEYKNQFVFFIYFEICLSLFSS